MSKLLIILAAAISCLTAACTTNSCLADCEDYLNNAREYMSCAVTCGNYELHVGD